MKYPLAWQVKNLVGLVVLCGFTLTAQAQSILGTWQLTKQTTCLEDEVTAESDSVQDLVDEMKSMGSAAPQVVRFKDKASGEETTRILSKKKPANSKSFLYKFSGEMLMILDKRSQTISDSYIVDKLTADSLILSNASRACETKIFLKIKEGKSN
ncbi:MAG: hypothetical protein ACOYXT_01580 [Bacteroidota bacterium]